MAFSASDNSNLPWTWALKMRFSAARYSFLSRNFQTNDDHNLPSLALQLSARLAAQSKFLIAIHLDIVEVQNSAAVPGLRFR